MRSPDQFIVRPKGSGRYKNTKDIGGVDFIVSTSEEDHKFSNREAEVIETPINYSGPIKKGDILLVHHNVFKFYNDTKGRRKSGRSFFRDDLFFVDTDQFFMYKKNGQWFAHDRYCFVSPVDVKNHHVLLNPSKNEPLNGIMEYPSDYLLGHGIQAGDQVCFTPESEYEFEVDGKVMYRVFDHQITMKL